MNIQKLWSVANGGSGISDVDNRDEAIKLLRDLADMIEHEPNNVLGLVISFGVRSNDSERPGVATDTLVSGSHASTAASFLALASACRISLEEAAKFLNVEVLNERHH